MLSPWAFWGFKKVLSIGCYLKFYPYNWNAKLKRLEVADYRGLCYFKFHKFVVYFMTIFSFCRLIQHFFFTSHFPLLPKILNLAWTFLYFQTTFSYVQFQINGTQILKFTNLLLQYIYKPKEKIPFKNRCNFDDENDKAKLQISKDVFIGLILLAINPGIHAILVEENPCVPHFTSSVVFVCESVGENSISFIYKIPFIIIEYYFITLLFAATSFNWFMIFLGLSWIRYELRKLSHCLCRRICPKISEYRAIECIQQMINSSFRLYLTTFPSLLFTIVSLLLFGCIRIWKESPTKNLMFPICGTRCGFEAITPLRNAGMVNDKNKEVIFKWKQQLRNHNKRYRKFLSVFLKSCNGVRCTAGSLYTFENSIVLCCVNNCMQLTLNLLVTFA